MVRLIRNQLLGHQYKCDRREKGQHHMLPGCFLQMAVRLITHQKHQENIDEGLAARKAVGIMESMPYKIKYIEREAGKKEQQQPAVHHFFPPFDVPVYKVQQKQHQNSHAAVDIRPVVQTDLRLHIRQMPRHHVEDGEIRSHRLRKVKIPGRGHLKRINLRKKHHRGQTACQQGKYRKGADIYHVIAPRFLSVHHQQGDEV